MVVVAIDGPSGVGKTTVSRAVADALGVPHLDTGSYYRVATLATLRASGDPATESDVLDALEDRTIDFVDGRLHLDGSDVSGLLRTTEVTAAVSAVAAHAGVRQLLVDHQRSWVAERGGSAVVEGRDIGTVVFPDTPIKVFLTADQAVRAARRAADEEASGRDIAEIETALMARDTADSTREVAPLQPAADAVVIDTSELSVAEVVGRILDLVGAV
ncbi:MAG TPA: (d)CMP kinase [Acidimicrobiia bacterium]|nr:(d)CMP kinase [Acidimicrobiia bacterium]